VRFGERSQLYFSYRVERSGLRLIYRTRRNGDEWRDIDELVSFATTTTNFSGHRAWFQCLSCRRRCRILYGGAYFRCRRCYQLRYESQYEPGFARAASRALKIRERLGDRGGVDDGFPEKPKHMRWTTYRKLEARYWRLQEQWCLGIGGFMRRLG
jgi:hypothetical protein